MRKFGLSLLLAGCCHGVWAADCDSYRGKPAPLAKDAMDAVGKAIAAIKAGNPRALLATSGGNLLLVRRSVSGGADSRSGNARLPLHARDIDAQLKIHVANLTVADFADRGSFDAINADDAVAVRRDVCEGESRCDDDLPPSVDLPFMLHDLLQCNQGAKHVFVFDDGLFVTNMRFQSGDLPVGDALFFTKTGKGYRLAGLIVQH